MSICTIMMKWMFCLSCFLLSMFQFVYNIFIMVHWKTYSTLFIANFDDYILILIENKSIWFFLDICFIFCSILKQCQLKIWRKDTVSFLAHLSQRLRWAFLIKICPLSVIVVDIVVVVVNFSHFHLLLQNHALGQFQPNLAQSIHGWKGFKLFKCSFPRGRQ